MRLEKSAILVLCALLAVVCGCGTEEPDADQGEAEVVVGPYVDQEMAELFASSPEGFTNSIGMKFKLIPAGEFMMGSPEDEEGHRENELQHRVRITQPYYLGVTEATQGQWEGVMGTRPWEGKSYAKSNPKHAVSWVSWDEAVEFCRKLSEKEGREYLLPTEAEWEYACRAGTTTRFCFGDDASDLGSYAWYEENTANVGEEYAHAVGQKQANDWGLYNMHGNVHEWRHDWYDKEHRENSPVDNPTGPSSGTFRVNRGGGWLNPAWCCRSACRFRDAPGSSHFNRGFRAALDPAE